MKRFHLVITAMVFTLLAAVVGMPGAAAAANTPPGPGSPNPAVQPDGILVPDVFGSTPNWNLSPPMRKFVDDLAPLGCAAPNNLGQCIPVAVPDKRTFSGIQGVPDADYYEIELRRYTEKLHTDLPNPTMLQGYVQVNNGTNAAGTANTVAPAPIHYLGPVIVAQKGRPVRIKFVNKLPLQSADPFFLPVDQSVMGAGMGSKFADGTDCDPVWDPRGIPGVPATKPNCADHAQNRAELHLHGGFTPWISDGTPHQWTTPAGEVTPYKKGASAQYVPDMWYDATGNLIAACAGSNTCNAPNASNNPGDGALTYYYTNDQSARLMFYHDHAYGITRLNVYAGEAAGYLIQDPTEQDLVTRGIIPADQIPLIIQDKGFVDASTIGTLDPTWVWGTGATLPTRWIDDIGTDIPSCAGQATCGVAGARKVIGKTPKTGDLWWPHVYMPAENPADLGGVNPMGRWVYGMYFWPPTTGIKFLPINNPYYDCDPLGVCNSPWEPPTMPASPNPSWVAEAFVDTPMVNGTVYPKLTVQPKAYRLRVLNAAHDRFFNLQLYVADGSVNPNQVNPACTNFVGGCASNTEVKMVPAIKYPAFPDWDASADQREGGVPDPATAGPAWIQIGNEGGFLPTPVVIANKPISYVMDPTLFNVGNVNDGTVILGPAERADVIIDFSQYAGKTLILYNDAPAAFPAFVPNNDYYTGAPDMRDTGGYGTGGSYDPVTRTWIGGSGPQAGIGPNTRTIMQINVAAATPAAPFNVAALVDEFTTTAVKDGVFKRSQEPTIVGQTAYDSAFNVTFPAVAPYWGIANIGDQKMSFQTLNPTTLSPEVVSLYPLEPKALHDEMGAVWDEYGRMSAKLGVELPNTSNINQIFVMQNYVDPPTENMQDGKVQIWKLTHNGVDTHPLHFHLFDVQVINRVGWDGFVRLPWPNELGWKETVRISPLEDTIVAMRPRTPPTPFKVADSNRLLNPLYLPGATDGFMNLNPLDGQAKVPAETNVAFDFGAEYVWHCHILSHEEQDMMRAVVLRSAFAPPNDPTGLTVTAGFQKNTLAWTDNSYTAGPPLYNMTLGFYVERCNGACNANNGNFNRIAELTLLPSAAPSYQDTAVTPGTQYTYRVTAYNRYTDPYTVPAAAVWRNGASAPAYSAPVTSQTWSPASAVSLTTDFASPHVAPVKFIAQASGSNAPYQYRFRLNDGTTTTTVQDYSATRFWVMPTTAVPGNYTMNVDVRTNFATTTPDISNQMAYTLLPIIDSTPPVTTAIPPAGTFLSPVTVYLQVNEPGSVIKYTIDGSDPTTSATAVVYTAPFSINATTTLKYAATDPAGNVEVVQSGLYDFPLINLNASVTVNGGATVTNNLNVTLAIAATGVTQMRFSNDNTTYTADEAFAASKAWTLAAGPDGVRTVYVRFTAGGVVQQPVLAQVMYDTLPPVTSPSPAPGIYLSTTNVLLTTDDPTATIKYTVDGSDPTTSASALVYSSPLVISSTTAVRFAATDVAGNVETPKTAIYQIHTSDLTVNTFTINGGAALTNTGTVTLNISATDPYGVTWMRFSNDGNNYTADEPYATVKNNWPLSAGDGLKVAYVRFTDGNGFLYDPVTTQITLDTTPPVTTTFPQSAGVYVNPISVTMTANEPGSVIKYTTDGTDPASPTATPLTYAGPVTLSTTTVLKFFAIDPAGNPEPVKTVTYTFTASTISATLAINGGALLTNNPTATLAVTATGATNMQFSNDGVNYSASELYAAGNKTWALDPVDGVKTVFAKFTDSQGTVLNIVSTQITLDVTAPVTTASPAPGTFINGVNVALSANEPGSTIKYTLDGSDPATSVTALVYTAAVNLASTATVRYYATDVAGNPETPKSGTYVVNSSTIAATIAINGGAAVTNAATVSLALTANGVDQMSFSNNGVNYSALEPYATSKTWALTAGDGVKTVFVRFHDTAHNLTYDPLTAQITLDTVVPTTTASPAPATFISQVNVALAASETGATIKYTLDGSDPTASGTAMVYTGPIAVAATTTIKYFAADPAGNSEPVKSGLYEIHVADLVVNTYTINSGAANTTSPNVTLTMDATDEKGVTKMRFSNDGITYSPDEAYATTKDWTLSGVDGVKNVSVRFTDGAGILYDAVTAQIRLDTTAPVTTVAPASGTRADTPFDVSLQATDTSGSGVARIRYTTDGSDPLTSATALVYSLPITIPSDTVRTIKYAAVDVAGNSEGVKTATFTVTHPGDLTATIKINNGAVITLDQNVTLTINAQDQAGVAAMQFSNDAVNYTPYEDYPATSPATKLWTLPAGDGLKTVYVKFRDGAIGSTTGNEYGPYTVQITLGTKDGLLPATSNHLQSALRAIQVANGLHVADAVDLAHGDVAPYLNGKSVPDGRINGLDAYYLMLKYLNMISGF